MLTDIVRVQNGFVALRGALWLPVTKGWNCIRHTVI